MNIYHQIVQGIGPLEKKSMDEASSRLDKLIKPIGSLGKLETIAISLAGITGKPNNSLNKRAMVVMCSDNGIVEEGVTCTPQSITAWQTMNMTKNICAINVLSNHAAMDIKLVDIGINSDIDNPNIINKKIRKGTSNMCLGPAMTREEAILAIEAGMAVTKDLVNEGYDVLGTGEMGIGNTSTSSAILMCFSGIDAEFAVGKGAGLTEEAFQNKKENIVKSIKVNSPNREDPIDVLSKLGGFDIAGLTGCFLAAAYYKVPIIIDGFISAVAALIAYKINPLTRGYMFTSHSSAEPGYKWVMKEMKLEPILDLNMRLGEGTGCPLALNVMDAALKLISEMATFEEASLKEDFLVDIRVEEANE